MFRDPRWRGGPAGAMSQPMFLLARLLQGAQKKKAEWPNCDFGWVRGFIPSVGVSVNNCQNPERVFGEGFCSDLKSSVYNGHFRRTEASKMRREGNVPRRKKGSQVALHPFMSNELFIKARDIFQTSLFVDSPKLSPCYLLLLAALFSLQ